VGAVEAVLCGSGYGRSMGLNLLFGSSFIAIRMASLHMGRKSSRRDESPADAGYRNRTDSIGSTHLHFVG
jgi:hypothetical protein